MVARTQISLATLIPGIALLLTTAAATGGELCANPEQVAQVAKFYTDNPGTLPVMAGRRLGMSTAAVSSALDEAQAASAPGAAFAEVWAAMTGFEQANFLIMKGQNVFEIMSGVSPGAPSTRSQYFNLKYENPLRGHLRPDLYSAIYAVALPGSEDTVIRGVMFLDEEGELVFGTFISGEALDPSPEALAKFDAVMEMVRSLPSVCASAG